MGRFLDLALLLFGLQATSSLAQLEMSPDDTVENPATTPSLAVSVSASFPNAEIFGIKLVNGKTTDSILSFSNGETEPVTVQFVGGSLWTPDFDPQGSRIVRNLTTKQFAEEIAPGEKKNIPFSFQTNMHPQELRLNLAAVVSQDNTFYTLQAFNGTVSVVEPNASIFDPQIIFLYFFLLACAVGIGYFFYNIWIAPYFPQKKKPGQRRSAERKKVDVATVDKEEIDSPATTTGAKAYNEEWIPSHHMQRPEARRVKSGTRPKSRGKPE